MENKEASVTNVYSRLSCLQTVRVLVFGDVWSTTDYQRRSQFAGVAERDNERTKIQDQRLQLHFWSNNNLENSKASEVEDEQNSYFSTPGALNIQNDTSRSGAHSTAENSLPGPSLDDPRDARSQNEVSRRYYTPKIMVSNVISLVPKMSEVSEFILRDQVFCC